MASPAVRLRKRAPVESKQDLLAIAIDCFALQGYQGTTIDMIARAAGVTKGALYYHFRDKEDLLFQAVRDRVNDFEHRVVDVVTPVADPVAALHEIADSCQFVATRNNHRRFLLTLMVEAIDSYPVLAEQFREMMHRFRSFVAGIVTVGQQRGVFRFDVEPRAAAKVFISGIMGAEIQHYQDADEVQLEDVLTGFVEGYLTWLGVREGNTPRADNGPPGTGGEK
jgi:AcrR family transcriptional regulator